MNIMLLGTNVLSCREAVEIILKNLLVSNQKEGFCFYAVSYSDKDGVCRVDDNVVSVRIKDAFLKLPFRIIRRCKRTLKIDDSLISWKYL